MGGKWQSGEKNGKGGEKKERAANLKLSCHPPFPPVKTKGERLPPTSPRPAHRRRRHHRRPNTHLR